MLRRQRWRWVMRKIGAQETQSPRLSGDGEGARAFERFGTMAARQIEYAEKRARGQRTALVLDGSGENAARRAEPRDTSNEFQDLWRRLLRQISVNDTTLAFAGDRVLAKQMMRLRIDDPDPQPANMNGDPASDVVHGA